MGNAKELRKARDAFDRARRTLEAIEHLPRRRGSLVLWTNGVVWQRLGDDEWESLHVEDGYEPHGEYKFDSEHVATSAGSFSPWSQINRLPARKERS